VLIIAAVLFFLRRRHNKQAASTPLIEIDGKAAYPMEASSGKVAYAHVNPVFEMGRHDPAVEGPFEMGGDTVPELDPQNDGKIKSTKPS
jgi:hypothetical protein